VQNNLYYSGKVFIVEDACDADPLRGLGGFLDPPYATVNKI